MPRRTVISTVAFTPGYYRRTPLFAPYVFRDGDEFVLRSLATSEYDYPSQEWFTKPLELDGGYWSEPYIDEGGGDIMMVTYAVPVKDRHGVTAAVLTADISLDWLRELIRGIQFYPNATNILISREGRFMVSPRGEELLLTDAAKSLSQLDDSISLLQVNRQMRSGQSGNMQVKIQGQKTYLYFSPVERTGWSMCILVPESDIFGAQKRIGLLVDEWGTWWDVEPGTNPGHLFQQNTMRDAMVAAYTLNIFHRYTRRVKMANIAQVVNVLQSMILTRGDQMVLTPTYHVFRMYNVHQDAQFVPVTYTTDRMAVDERTSVPTLSVTASRKDGALHVSLANADLTVDNAILLTWDEIGAGGLSRAAQKALSVSGEILSSASIGDFNDFGVAPKLTPAPMKDLRVSAAGVEFTLPAHSIATIEIR